MRRAIISLSLVAGLLCFAQIACGQDDHGKLYNWSVVAMAGAQTADIASSWGGVEANPVLGAGQRFGWKATGIKVGIAGGAMLFQRFVLRRHPRHQKAAAFVNFAMAGATTGVAVRNWRIRQ